MSSAKLHDELKQRGVSLGGQNPVSNLSAMLSKNKELFQSHGKEGWTLNEGAVPSDSKASEAGKLDQEK